MQNSAPALKLQPMIHVDDMAASIQFYEALGGVLLTESRDGDWAQIAIGGAEVGVLAHPANPEQHEGQVELNFEASEPLDALQARLESAGVKSRAAPPTKPLAPSFKSRPPTECS